MSATASHKEYVFLFFILQLNKGGDKSWCVLKHMLFGDGEIRILLICWFTVVLLHAHSTYAATRCKIALQAMEEVTFTI